MRLSVIMLFARVLHQVLFMSTFLSNIIAFLLAIAAFADFCCAQYSSGRFFTGVRGRTLDRRYPGWLSLRCALAGVVHRLVSMDNESVTEKAGKESGDPLCGGPRSLTRGSRHEGHRSAIYN